MFELDADALQKLSGMLHKRLEAGALELGIVLEENLSAGSRSGTQYPSLPRRSSAPGEYPQEQTGQLISGVFVEPTADPLVFEVGIEDDAGKLMGLEFEAPSQGGRAPLRRTITDAKTHQRVREAMNDP
jgi:hypothetical protein